MNCISCGLQAGYNRAVVALVSGDQLGGFCRNCEFDIFGHMLSEVRSSDETCALCERDALYAIPAWQPYEKLSDDRITCDVQYTVHERTPMLCDEHFHELCTEERKVRISHQR